MPAIADVKQEGLELACGTLHPGREVLREGGRGGGQERAVKLLQNVFAYCTPRDVEAAHAWSGGVALRLLVSAADPAASVPPLQRSHALYGLCNVAVSGTRSRSGPRVSECGSDERVSRYLVVLGGSGTVKGGVRAKT